jgi:hypothetical protein
MTIKASRIERISGKIPQETTLRYSFTHYTGFEKEKTILSS